MRAQLSGSNYILTLHQIINRTWLPFLNNEIAKPRPDMNIKVTAFTVTKLYNIVYS